MNYLMNMMKQVKKIKNGIGIQAILDEAYKILGNPIAMNNTEYTLQAYTEVETDDPIWIELIELGTFGAVTQRFFEKAGFVEEVANNRIAYLKTEYLKYDRINGKLFSKNNTHISNLVIVACNKPFEEGDQQIFEAICELMGREISDNIDIVKYEQAHQELLIKNLIEGNYDKKMDVAQVEILYGTLGQSLYLAVVGSTLANNQTDLSYIIEQFKSIEPTYKYAVYSECIVVIMSTNNEELHIEKELSKLLKNIEQNNLYIGISDRFENLFELEKHFILARKSLDYVMKCKCSQRIFPYQIDSLEKVNKIEEIKDGTGIQHFLDTAAKIFGNPVLFHDLELNLLAYSKNLEIKDPIWLELITYGTSSDKTIGLFKSEGMIAMMESVKGGSYLISDKFKYDRISWKIYNNENIMIGCASIVNSSKPFSEDDLVLFGLFSQKFSEEISKIKFYNDYGQIYSETIINRLISGKIDGTSFYTKDIGNLYDDLLDSLYLIVLDTSQCKNEHSNLSYIRELFNRSGALNRYTIYSSYIVIIVSTNDVLCNENLKFNKIIEVLEQDKIYFGVSERFDNIYELPIHYNEAVISLKNRINESK